MIRNGKFRLFQAASVWAVDLEEGASALQDILPGILANRTDILKHYSTQSSVHLFNLISYHYTAGIGLIGKCYMHNIKACLTNNNNQKF